MFSFNISGTVTILRMSCICLYLERTFSVSVWFINTQYVSDPSPCAFINTLRKYKMVFIGKNKTQIQRYLLDIPKPNINVLGLFRISGFRTSSQDGSVSKHGLPPRNHSKNYIDTTKQISPRLIRKPSCMKVWQPKN